MRFTPLVQYLALFLGIKTTALVSLGEHLLLGGTNVAQIDLQGNCRAQIYSFDLAILNVI